MVSPITDQQTRMLHEIQAYAEEITRLHENLNRSHRCWPSRWGWGTVIVLLLYILLLTSWQATATQTARAAWKAYVDAQLAAEVQAREDGEETLRQAIVDRPPPPPRLVRHWPWTR